MVNDFEVCVVGRDVSQFTDQYKYIKFVDDRLFTLFPDKHEQRIADAILELFRKNENLDIFNKKALYIYVKEMTEASTPQITKIIKRLKVVYVKKYNEYYEHGRITMSI